MLTTSRLATAFRVAAAELGHWSAAWLFIRELAGGGDAAIESLRDALGRTFPVLDAVARQWLEGERSPRLDMERVLARCESASSVLVCGVEATALDALSAALPRDVRIGLLQHSTLEVDWARVLSNYGGRVAAVDLATFQLWAGYRSVLIAFAYGTREHATHVDPGAARVIGPDVRVQFRSVLAWEILRSRMYVYPRWLTELPLRMFSEVLG